MARMRRQSGRRAGVRWLNVGEARTMKRIVFAVALVVLGGCAGTTIDVSIERAPRGPYDGVAVDHTNHIEFDPGGRRNFVGSSKDWLEFRRRLVEALRASDAFAELLDPDSAPLAESALRVSPERGG